MGRKRKVADLSDEALFLHLIGGKAVRKMQMVELKTIESQELDPKTMKKIEILGKVGDRLENIESTLKLRGLLKKEF